MIKEIFTWWNGKTLGTRIWSYIYGIKVGQDRYNNLYYRDKSDSKRWVIYGDQVESTLVNPEWNNWLRYTSTDLPSNKKKHQWQKDHIPNETGTDKSYDPEKSRIKNHKVKNNEYKKWKPN